MRKRGVLVAVFVLVACSGSTAINIQNYDRSCNNATVCVAVQTDACCGCQTSAINKDALAQFQSDLAAAKSNCGGVSCQNMACQNLVVGCAAGVCVTEPAPVDAGGD
jgi:hypothetical protein